MESNSELNLFSAKYAEQKIQPDRSLFRSSLFKIGVRIFGASSSIFSLSAINTSIAEAQISPCLTTITTFVEAYQGTAEDMTLTGLVGEIPLKITYGSHIKNIVTTTGVSKLNLNINATEKFNGQPGSLVTVKDTNTGNSFTSEAVCGGNKVIALLIGEADLVKKGNKDRGEVVTIADDQQPNIDTSPSPTHSDNSTTSDTSTFGGTLGLEFSNTLDRVLFETGRFNDNLSNTAKFIIYPVALLGIFVGVRSLYRRIRAIF